MKAEQLAEKLVVWIKDKVLSGTCEGVVIGMSGGLDSSVVAVLCQRAFPLSTLGLIMPCHSNEEDEKHALALANKFSVPTITVVLDNVFNTLIKVLPSGSTDSTTCRLVEANLKSRLRMLALYYVANQLKYMVVGSSNRSELAVGYFTKYGDSGVDIIPLGSLVKGQVRELAKFLNIPQEIINKPPAAGLWEGQTDEAELGCRYDELDCYLTGGNTSDEVSRKIESMINASTHKRCTPPIAYFQD